ETWLLDVEYKDRISKETDKTQVKLCNKTINLSNMGQEAFKSHCKSQRHSNKMAVLSRQPAISGFLPKPEQVRPTEPSAMSITTNTPAVGNIPTPQFSLGSNHIDEVTMNSNVCVWRKHISFKYGTVY